MVGSVRWEIRREKEESQVREVVGDELKKRRKGSKGKEWNTK